ncbi:DsbA family protein [Acinetobacter sp. MD2]|uniref:DsbA family protein n=1 Tax=Acinetobacter sp. MD2 TaxID=2600066 RepID=UPI002D1F60C2|nr:DsbA family protein [Acinetobacter sp. MD2]MEB3766350.1 DsbA family protein [Acinetobacter sp. MD2]
MTQSLHWIIDPICGWSYGILPLINAAQSKYPQLQQLHFGGLYIGDSRQPMDNSLRQRIVQYDQHIHQLTGAKFGEVYKNELLRKPAFVLDSYAATQTLVTAKQHLNIAQQVKLLTQIQTAYYQRGVDITQISVLSDLIETSDLNIANNQWQAWLATVDNKQVSQEIMQARELMMSVHGQGFPTLVLEQTTQKQIKIDVSKYYGRPDEFAHYLDSQLN